MKHYNVVYFETYWKLYNALHPLSCKYFNVSEETNVPEDIVRGVLYGSERKLTLVEMLSALRTLGELK